MNDIRKCLMALCLLAASAWMSGCQTGAATTGSGTATTENGSLAPQRVDIRGSIIRRHYDQGQVMLEVDGFPSQYSRYNRAYVLVLPTTQIVDTDGQTISLSELQQGQNVAVLLRGGGEGNLMGVGVARKVWVEEIF
ncbi:hypothetical protein [Pontibacter russatus]|uniref:hypothetical protein n=1 Tax=Pontibacter russatus TaxID=2694929 RepID=UPI00137B294B|nr:hypothetical protein [Pontibacter russatus]